MILELFLQAANSFDCFAKATLSSQVTSKIVTLNLEPNEGVDCQKYYMQNNTAELIFGTALFNNQVADFAYTGGSTSIDFDYMSLSDPDFKSMLSETLIVFKIMLVNVVQQGSIARIDHTYINATNCWSDVSLTYQYMQSLALGFTPLKCNLLNNSVSISLEWRIGQTWSEYPIYVDYTGFDYSVDTSIVIDDSKPYYQAEKFAQFFADLDTNITLEARMTLSYMQNGLQMLIVSLIQTIKTAPCLDLLGTTSYLSRYYVQFNFDTTKMAACAVGTPTKVHVQASALGVFLAQTLSYDAFVQEASVLLDVPDYLTVLTDNTNLQCVFVVTFEDASGNKIYFYKIQNVQLSCLKQIEVIAKKNKISAALFRIDAERCHFDPSELYDTTLQLVGKKDTGEYKVYVSLAFKATLFIDTVLADFDNSANSQSTHIKTGILQLRNAMKNGDQVYFILMNSIERQVGYNLAFDISNSLIIWFCVISGLMFVVVVIGIAIVSYKTRI